jgi:hypothetical protein
VPLLSNDSGHVHPLQHRRPRPSSARCGAATKMWSGRCRTKIIGKKTKKKIKKMCQIQISLPLAHHRGAPLLSTTSGTPPSAPPIFVRSSAVEVAHHRGAPLLSTTSGTPPSAPLVFVRSSAVAVAHPWCVTEGQNRCANARCFPSSGFIPCRGLQRGVYIASNLGRWKITTRTKTPARGLAPLFRS